MKVILLQDVDNLGKSGDLKDVADGYARNYLIPKRLASAATPTMLANHQQHIAAEKRRQEKEAEASRQQAEQLSGVSLTFKARVGKQGRLYGSITSQDIAAGLRDSENIVIDRRAIVLTDPIRAVGTYQVPVKLGGKHEPKITVKVIDEAEEAVATEKAAAAE